MFKLIVMLVVSGKYVFMSYEPVLPRPECEIRREAAEAYMHLVVENVSKAFAYCIRVDKITAAKYDR